METLSFIQASYFPSRRDPSLGAVNGSSLFPGYGNYRGFFDELRIYDRGIDEFEVTQVFDDTENEGFLDFLAIEKQLHSHPISCRCYANRGNYAS